MIYKCHNSLYCKSLQSYHNQLAPVSFTSCPCDRSNKLVVTLLEIHEQVHLFYPSRGNTICIFIGEMPLHVTLNTEILPKQVAGVHISVQEFDHALVI